MGTAFQAEEFDKTLQHFESPLGPRIVIIGAGPVGMRCASKIKESHQGPCHIAVFNGEAYAPYDRIKLTQLLTNQVNYPDIFWSASPQSDSLGHPQSSFEIINDKVSGIDTKQKMITAGNGEIIAYDKLILATGSKPHIPQIDGIEMTGVYTFRNIRDVEFLMARTQRSRHTVVVGGGLLGLEAAKGLHQKNTLVTLVHQAPRLMNRQLNDLCADVLYQHVRKAGINVITNDGLGAVHGDNRVTGISTRHGKPIDCDTVVLCTGIKPNIDLAVSSGIKFNRGILVDKNLQTSERDVYAVGECSEYEGQIYGLVSPGLEQATILAENLAGGSAVFSGTQPYTKLKVLDVKVSSLGEITELGKRPKLKKINYTQNTKKTESKTSPVCRTIAVQGGKFFGSKLVGACGIGDWTELQRLRECLTQQRTLYPWQLWLFRFSGKLWLDANDNNPTLWPASTIVCQCNQVTRQNIDTAITQGCHTLTAISHECGAGGVCGSCQPVVQTLLHQHLDATNAGSQIETVQTDKSKLSSIVASPIFLTSALSALLVLLLVLFPGVQMPSSVQEFSLAFFIDDKLYKQISGFSLLAAVSIGLILSLRKRLNWQFLGQFTRWRLVHTISGVVALIVLLAHTGANLGDQLNRLLMVNFLVVALVGAALGTAISISQSNIGQQRLRSLSFWLHVLTVWPLPILLSAHIFSSYYF